MVESIIDLLSEDKYFYDLLVTFLNNYNSNIDWYETLNELIIKKKSNEQIIKYFKTLFWIDQDIYMPDNTLNNYCKIYKTLFNDSLIHSKNITILKYNTENLPYYDLPMIIEYEIREFEENLVTLLSSIYTDECKFINIKYKSIDEIDENDKVLSFTWFIQSKEIIEKIKSMKNIISFDFNNITIDEKINYICIIQYIYLNMFSD